MTLSTLVAADVRQLVTAQLKTLRKHLSRYAGCSLPKSADVETMLSGLGRTVIAAESAAADLETKIERLRARKVQHAHIAQACRTTLSAAMQMARIDRLEDPEFTASLTPGRPKTLIIDETALPPEYIRTRTEPMLGPIGDALRTGMPVPGAALGPADPILTIRRA